MKFVCNKGCGPILLKFYQFGNYRSNIYECLRKYTYWLMMSLSLDKIDIYLRFEKVCRSSWCGFSVGAYGGRYNGIECEKIKNKS